MSISTKELHAALKTFFGFDKFKGLQEQVIVSLLEQKTHLCYYANRWREITLLSIARVDAGGNSDCGVSFNRTYEKSSGCDSRYFELRRDCSCIKFFLK